MTSPTDTMTIIRDFALATASIATVFIALEGLHTWRRELRGKAHFEVARGLIYSTYDLRNKIESCRSRFIAAQEFPKDYYDVKGDPTPENQAKGYAYVYRNRWQPILDSLKEFDAQSLEAEALWGADIKSKTDNFRRCSTTLFVAIEAFIENEQSGGRIFESDKPFGIEMRKKVSAHGYDDDNMLSKKIVETIGEIEDKIRPYLDRS